MLCGKPFCKRNKRKNKNKRDERLLKTTKGTFFILPSKHSKNRIRHLLICSHVRKNVIRFFPTRDRRLAKRSAAHCTHTFHLHKDYLHSSNTNLFSNTGTQCQRNSIEPIFRMKRHSYCNVQRPPSRAEALKQKQKLNDNSIIPSWLNKHTCKSVKN